MLTLLPLSGIQDVFKRRNSTTMEQFTDRRGSISVYDTYSLPTSKADMRRFSSYEQLAPFFQQILSHENGKMTPAPAPVPAAAPVPAVSPTSTTDCGGDSISPTIPSPLVRSRRGSISRFTSALTGSFRRQKSALKTKPVSESDSDVSCNDLDAKLAEIKEKLAQFKSEDIDMSQRVEDLTSSVEELYTTRTPDWCCSRGDDSHQDQLFYQLREHKIAGQMHRSNSWQNYRPSHSKSGLHSISETTSEVDDSEEEEDEECQQQQDEEVLMRTTEVRLRRSTPVQRSRPSSYASISEEPEPDTALESPMITTPPSFVNDNTNTKSYCLLNNTIATHTTTRTRSRAHSMSQLPHMIKNDLTHTTSASNAATSSKRNSVISIMSDSVLITQRHHHLPPAMQSLLKQHEF